MIWKNPSSHPHILTLLGVDVEAFPDEICMVSEWMNMGTIIELLEREPYPVFSVEEYVRRARQCQVYPNLICCGSCFRLQRVFSISTRTGYVMAT